jgi:hypothetical protein
LEETALKKDETPYLIFACNKCQQYSYVKTSQKTKKCVRCGRLHQVKSLLNEGVIVCGMTLAVNTVQRKQNELSVPEFRTHGDFMITTNRSSNNTSSMSPLVKKIKNKNENISKFKALLQELSNLHDKFPAYMIEIMAENGGIPSQELPHLIKMFKKRGYLILLKDEDFYYKISLEF